MGRAPCCAKVGLHKGSWSKNEDKLLVDYIEANGEGKWRSLPKKAGLLRCGKSCRLRWMNYLRPGIKRGNITKDEEDLIIQLQSTLGNCWSTIAGKLPGRTDNEIKNHWNTHILKRLEKEGIQPKESHKSLSKKSNKKEPSKKKSNKIKKKPIKERSGLTTSISFGSLESDISTITTSTWNQERVIDKQQENYVKECSGLTTSISFGSSASDISTITTSTWDQERIFDELQWQENDRVKECSELTRSMSFGSLTSDISTITTSTWNQEQAIDKQQLPIEDQAKTSTHVSDLSCSSIFELDDLCYHLRIDEDQILFDDEYDDVSLQGVAAVSDNLLDKVYYEYLQLL
ncbi:hypothetical protein ACH5RR_038272 [Cinchona calisaya]|uniref:Uncharacterized protein n=1 Tax=Cinchona calisaya TaxID=153742 RepID=A0ABD2XY90_9GENT